MEGWDYILCGWRVHSALPLPELLPWPGDPEGGTDITIVQGPVDVAQEDSWVTVRPDGAVVLSIPDLVRIRSVDGHHVTVDILQPDEDSGWRLFLLGAALGFVCHQRGVFPLHAATVQIGARTVALMGESGSGKSTLAFTLMQRGHRLLSDDVSVLVPHEERVDLLPAFPRLKLWQDTLDAMKHPKEGLKRVRAGMDKFDLQPRGAFDPSARPLDGIVVLRRGPVVALTPVSTAEAVPLLCANVARPQVAYRLGRKAALFAEAARIASRVPLRRLVRSADFREIAHTARLVEESA